MCALQHILFTLLRLRVSSHPVIPDCYGTVTRRCPHTVRWQRGWGRTRERTVRRTNRRESEQEVFKSTKDELLGHDRIRWRRSKSFVRRFWGELFCYKTYLAFKNKAFYLNNEHFFAMYLVLIAIFSVLMPKSLNTFEGFLLRSKRALQLLLVVILLLQPFNSCQQ